MITSKEIKIKAADTFCAKYIDSELKKTGLDIISWAIISYDNGFYTLNISFVCKE